MVRFALVFALVAGVSPALAQDDVDAPEPERKGKPGPEPGDKDGVKPVGTYSGVVDENAGAVLRAGRRGKHPRVLWIGFRAREAGGARLFVQLDREVEAGQA